MRRNILKSLLIYLVFGLIIFTLFTEAAPAKGRKKQKKTRKSSSSSDPDTSSSKRPTSTSPELYCNACQAVIREAVKSLKHRTSESDVMEYLSEVCNPEKYMIYEFPPPEMREGCEAFIMDWEEIIERELINRQGNDLIEDKVCIEISKACKNVDVKNAPRFDNEIFVDGQPVPVGADGKVDLGKKNDDEL